MAFKYFNANKLHKKANDCSIRAISLATGKTWDDTYKELSNYAREYGVMMDDKQFLEKYLDDRYSRACYYSSYVDEFIHKHPVGIYIVSIPNHLTCIIDGINYDTFDTRNRLMYCAWKVSD